MKGLARSKLAPVGGFPDLPPVAGFAFATKACGVRYQGREDVTLMAADSAAPCAALFTRSATAGHPVLWGRRIRSHGVARAVIVNSGNANVFRGADGDRAVAAEAGAVAAALGCAADQVHVASTGVIGEKLAVDKITAATPALAAALDPAGVAAAARAIMTTDTFPKGAWKEVAPGGAKIVGIAKGSGMIEPDMATMLAFLFTDAAIAPGALDHCLRRANASSFQSLTVDGDTSTSDSVYLFASGRAGGAPIEDPDDPALRPFEDALRALMEDLAEQVARDGEGATKLITIRVEGAASDADAARIGKAVANSPLVKTAIAGGDANWGRVVMAVGKAGVALDAAALEIAFGGHVTSRGGAAVEGLDEAPIAAHLEGDDIALDIKLGEGPGAARIWTCDLTHGYVDINADYRS